MGITTLLRRFHVPFDGQGFVLYRCAIGFADRNSLGTQRDHFIFIENENTTCVFEYGRDIGSQELFAVSNANNQWSTTQAGSNQHIWLLRTDNSDGVGAYNTLQSEAHSLLKIVPGFTEVVALNQV